MSLAKRLGKKQNLVIGFIGAILVLCIVGYGAYTALVGTKIFDANDFDVSGLNACLDHTTNDVGGVFSASKGVLTISATSAKYCVICVTYEFYYSDWKDDGIRQIVIDPSQMEVLAGWDKIKVYLYDGVIQPYIGSIETLKPVAFQVTADDVDICVPTDHVALLFRAYNSTGDFVDVFDKVEQELKTDFTTGGTYDTVYALVAAGAINIFATFKRFIAGVAGSIGGVIVSAFTNSTVVIVLVSIGVCFALLLFGPRPKGFKFSWEASHE